MTTITQSEFVVTRNCRSNNDWRDHTLQRGVKECYLLINMENRWMMSQEHNGNCPTLPVKVTVYKKRSSATSAVDQSASSSSAATELNGQNFKWTDPFKIYQLSGCKLSFGDHCCIYKCYGLVSISWRWYRHRSMSLVSMFSARWDESAQIK